MDKARRDGQWTPPFAERPRPLPTAAPTVRAEGAGWLVVEKPADVLSVPGRGPLSDCLESALARSRGGFVKMAHRLDMATSGLMVAATTPEALPALQAQFREREVEKEYEALLSAPVANDAGTLRLFTRLDVAERPRQIHDLVHGRLGITDWQVLQRSEERVRILFRPRTGRTHQLRVHAAHPLGLNAPILGDRLYGAGEPTSRLLLHARRLRFKDPATGWWVDISSPAPF